MSKRFKITVVIVCMMMVLTIVVTRMMVRTPEELTHDRVRFDTAVSTLLFIVETTSDLDTSSIRASNNIHYIYANTLRVVGALDRLELEEWDLETLSTTLSLLEHLYLILT